MTGKAMRKGLLWIVGFFVVLLLVGLVVTSIGLDGPETVHAGRMPGEYVLGEDGDGPIDVFWAGTLDGIHLYRMRDIETGASCYIVGRYDGPAIACTFDPLTPRG